jgi:hypothetical protein
LQALRIKYQATVNPDDAVQFNTSRMTLSESVGPLPVTGEDLPRMQRTIVVKMETAAGTEEVIEGDPPSSS